MLTRGWRRGLAVLAVSGVLSLAALPAPARADTIRDNQQWVLNMLNVPSVWADTEGRGVTVAVIDSGVNPHVSDLTGSVTTGPDYTGVSTSPSSQDWGVHGTWMASLIAGHGHGGGSSGVIGIAPHARVLSIRVIRTAATRTTAATSVSRRAASSSPWPAGSTTRSAAMSRSSACLSVTAHQAERSDRRCSGHTITASW